MIRGLEFPGASPVFVSSGSLQLPIYFLSTISTAATGAGTNRRDSYTCFFREHLSSVSALPYWALAFILSPEFPE